MYLQELSDKVWRTKNARFLAYHRMHRCYVSSTVCVAMLTVTIISVNMLAFFNVDDTQKTLISIVTVILSVFALAVSLLIAFMRYEYREENYHQCGIELDTFNQRLKIRINELQENSNADGIASSIEENTRFLEDYYAILKKYDQNHAEIDYLYSSLKSDQDSKRNFWLLLWYWIRYYIWDISVVYWIIAFVPFIIIMIDLLDKMK